jgi:hypothetical protein
VVHDVDALEPALRLFRDVLTGDVVADGTDWVELRWPGPGRVRLRQSPDGASGVHHLAFAVDDPAAVPDARPADDGSWIVEPEHNLGTRLVLSARTP